MKKPCIFALTAVICLAFTGQSLGEIVTVEVAGTVDSISTTGGFILDDSVSNGSAMTGTFIYGSNTPDLDSGSSYHGSYTLLSLSMTIGNYIFTHDPTSPNPGLFDVWKTDITYLARTNYGIATLDGTSQSYDNIYIELMDVCNASTTGPDDALPTSFPDISFFNYRNEFEVNYSNSGVGFAISGVLTSIPEPATLLLLGFGAVMLRRKG